MGKNTNPTQNQRIIDYMMEFGSITQLQALRDLGVMRLASRISDLRKGGWAIESVTETIMNRYGEPCRIKRYYLNDESGLCNPAVTSGPEERVINALKATLELVPNERNVQV